MTRLILAQCWQLFGNLLLQSRFPVNPIVCNDAVKQQRGGTSRRYRNSQIIHGVLGIGFRYNQAGSAFQPFRRRFFDHGETAALSSVSSTARTVSFPV